MALITLMVSLLMSGVTFWAVNDIQTDARLSDTRFGKDLSLLLAANVAPLVAQNNLPELERVSTEFYESSSSIRYILYAHADGEIYFGIPFSATEVQNSLTIKRRIQLPDDPTLDPDRPFVRQHASPQGQVTDVFVNLSDDRQSLGILAIGINPNPAVVVSSGLTLDVTTAVFVSIWAMVILGAASNAITITRPIKELVQGVKSIAGGNFKQKIDLPFGGELGELIHSFNEMAQKLERYEEQNIEELTAEKAKLENLISTIADGALLLDSDLKIVLANPATLRLFQWTDIIGHRLLNALPERLCAEIARPLLQISAGEWEGGEFRVTGDGDKNPSLRIWVSPVISSNNSLKGIALTFQDITREVELNAAQGRFISNVSHELRTPLFNIKSFIETLHDYDAELTQEQKREFLDTANRETDRLTRLVNDVLDLSRLESGRPYRFDGIDLRLPIEQTLRTYKLNAGSKGIHLTSEVEENLPKVWGNYDLLLQVFSNLVGNALKFTPEGGKVIIRAQRWLEPNHKHPYTSIERVRVAVEDTGLGIAVEDQRHIFDRFFRVENRVHTLEGTGLGLSIVRNIVEKHHSHIHLTSSVGTGSTFWFDLSIHTDRCDLADFQGLQLVGHNTSGLATVGD